MGLSNAYMSVQEYRASAVKTTDADNITLARDLEMIARAIDDAAGSFFYNETQTRVFVPKWSDRLDLDYEGLCPGVAGSKVNDVWTAPTLTIKVDTDNDGSFADETAWSVGDYVLEPRSALQGPMKLPYDLITIPSRSSKRFIPGRETQITGPFGYPEVPSVVVALNGKWTEIWRLEGPEGTGQITQLESVFSVSIDVKRLMDQVLATCRSRKVTL